MTGTPPTPFELVDSPELGVLYALETALDLAGRALMAAYPELHVGFGEGPEPLTAAVCLAEAILLQADALESLVGRYRLLLAQLESRRRLRSDPEI